MPGFADIQVQVPYATMATLNKLRAWARKNGAIVKMNRYARDAYEGHINILSPWNEGRDVVDGKAKELRALLCTLGCK